MGVDYHPIINLLFPPALSKLIPDDKTYSVVKVRIDAENDLHKALYKLFQRQFLMPNPVIRRGLFLLAKL